MKRTARTTRTAFTLIELLVVISIIGLVMALSFPMLAAMKRDASASSGVNTISIAVSAARRYATDPQRTFASTDLDPTNTQTNEPGLFSGIAVVFTPAGECRLVKNIENARVNYGTISMNLERLESPFIPPVITPQDPGPPKLELNGFGDMDLDYILLSSDVGVVGMTRDNNIVKATDPPLLLPPPFAIWFDENGYMIVSGKNILTGRDNDYQFVYYDGNDDGNYECTQDRASVSPYNPDEYDPHSADFVSSHYINDKYSLPFEKIEAVVGVFVYSKGAFQIANDNWTTHGITDPNIAAPPWTDMTKADNDTRWEWMKANGKMMLFSRQTGMIMRNRNE